MQICGDATSAVQWALQTLKQCGNVVQSVTDKRSIGSNFGQKPRPTVETIAAGFAISRPRARVSWFRARTMNVPFALANYLWTLFGEDSLEMIGFYNDRARAFSPDGTKLVGSIGKRIFRFEGVDQFNIGLQRLRDDPTSRRVLLQMLSPHDLVDPPFDTPCSASFQLFVRDHRLHWITYMRSQSAAMVLPYDLFVFTMMHETASLSLGVELGTYHHFCGSLHYYIDEEEIASRMLNEQIDNDLWSMPVMDSNPLEKINELRKIERELRAALGQGGDCSFLRSAGLSEYWFAIFSVIAILMQRRLNIPVCDSLLANIPESFKYLIAHE